MDWSSSADALRIVTGARAVFYGSERTPALESLADFLRDGRPLTAGTGGIPEPAHPGISGERLYLVQAVDERAGTVTVVDPWARHDTITMSFQQYVEVFAGTTVGAAGPPGAADRAGITAERVDGPICSCAR